MNERTLYLGWEDRAGTREWFPVGRLDADVAAPRYRFRHLRGAVRARETGGFDLVPGFPELHREYQSPELFPVFQNRVMSPRRPDFEDYMRGLDLDRTADPVETLWVDGGRRVTDFFDVFPKLVREPDGSFVCRFFPDGMDRQRPEALRPGERVLLSVDHNTGSNGAAIPIRTPGERLIGWVPSCFGADLRVALLESDGQYEATVVRVNPPPHPWDLSVLVEMRSRWENHEPMSGEDFEPLA